MSRSFDCRAIAARYFDWAAKEFKKLRRKPHLATVLFRPKQNPASLQYRDLILRDAAKVGVTVDGHEAEDEKELLSLVARLNADRKVEGVMLFHPLRSSLKDEEVMDMISPYKDVEGLHSVNLGYLIKFRRYLDEAKGLKCVVPATAKAVVKTVTSYPEIALEGAFAAVVNNSMRVGKPLGLMLENLGATVVKCYDKTPKAVLEECVRKADIVVTAVPDPSFRLPAEWVKPGAAVVDVSYQGNVDHAALGHAAFATAPDNRIGVMTRAMTFVNLVYCAQAQRRRSRSRGRIAPHEPVLG